MRWVSWSVDGKTGGANGGFNAIRTKSELSKSSSQVGNGLGCGAGSDAFFVSFAARVLIWPVFPGYTNHENYLQTICSFVLVEELGRRRITKKI